ncbi:MAG: histone deacetylase [Candidatus Zixiibacteriota bacterium]|nr:MAG: histone deacetylase [candidate division Zixibacteria bacterium]
MKIIYSETCLEYSQPGHPESPERVRSTYEHLGSKYEIVEPQAAAEEDILAVHTPDLVGLVRSGNFYDGDSPAYPNLYEHAMLSVGGAIAAADLALKGTPAFSLLRPPGHHAGRNFLGGFCYFNNIAVAVAKTLDEAQRIAIIDFDCHHGNGTEDICHGRENVLYVSLHQSPLYPGTGITSDLNCLNYPVRPGTGEEEYMATFLEALESVSEFNPGMIAVSAGFDTFKEDPITNVSLEIDTYGKIAQRIKALGRPVFSVLEGGYSASMPRCVEAYLEGLET